MIGITIVYILKGYSCKLNVADALLSLGVKLDETADIIYSARPETFHESNIPIFFVTRATALGQIVYCNFVKIKFCDGCLLFPTIIKTPYTLSIRIPA